MDQGVCPQQIKKKKSQNGQGLLNMEGDGTKVVHFRCLVQ